MFEPILACKSLVKNPQGNQNLVSPLGSRCGHRHQRPLGHHPHLLRRQGFRPGDGLALGQTPGLGPIHLHGRETG